MPIPKLPVRFDPDSQESYIQTGPNSEARLCEYCYAALAIEGSSCCMRHHKERARQRAMARGARIVLTTDQKSNDESWMTRI